MAKQLLYCSSCGKPSEVKYGLCENCTTTYNEIVLEKIKKEEPFEQTAPESKLLSTGESNPQYNIVTAFQLVLSSIESNSKSVLGDEYKLLSLLESIFGTKQLGSTFFYFIKKGAATAWTLQVQLSLPESTTYRLTKRLKSLGLIEEVKKITRFRSIIQPRGGPRPIVYAMPNCSHAKIADAILLHHRSLNPKWRFAEELVPTIISDYMEPRGLKTLERKWLLQWVKETSPPYNVGDIVDLAIPIFKMRGVTVSR